MSSSAPEKINLIPEAHAKWRVDMMQKLSIVSDIEFVDSATWAIAWLSDQEKLRTFLSGDTADTAMGIFSNDKNLRILRMSAAKTKPTNIPEEEGSRKQDHEEVDEPSNDARSEVAKTQCRERDNMACVLTLAEEPLEVCHIFPYLGDKEGYDQNLFWGLLRSFWTRDKITAWKAEIFGEEGTEVCTNLITMCASAHGLWSNARFALEPIEQAKDERSLTVRFWWIPTKTYAKFIHITEVPSLDTNVDSASGTGHTKLFNGKSEMKICSGDTIKITTHDPKTHPLASINLLEMQWLFQRLVALSGAANVDEEDLEDSDSEEDD